MVEGVRSDSTRKGGGLGSGRVGSRRHVMGWEAATGAAREPCAKKGYEVGGIGKGSGNG